MVGKPRRSTLLLLATLTACGGPGPGLGTDRDGGPIVDGGPAIDAGTPEERFDAYIAQQMADARIPGLSLGIVKGGRLVFAKGYGLAHIEENRPVTADTLFQIASVSKLFIATAAMQLYEEGTVDLDEDVNRYLPFSVRNPSFPDHPITLRMLLTHTSSIQDNCDAIPEQYRPGDPTLPLSQLLFDYFDPSGRHYDPDNNFLPRPPGTSYEYANIGATLAAYVLEVASGVPFDRYCKERIFEPLGMTETSWRLADLDPSRIAMPYEIEGRQFVPQGHYGYPHYPAGSVRTSVPQLARFLIAILQKGEIDGTRILQPASVEEMLREQVPGADDPQGIIWYWRFLGGSWDVGHNGSDNGEGACAFFRPDAGVGVLWMMNIGWNDANDAASIRIETRMYEEAARF